MRPASDFVGRIARAPARAIGLWLAFTGEAALRVGGASGTKALFVLLIAIFGYLTSNAADPYPHLNAYWWSVSSNSVPRNNAIVRSYADLVMPKIIFDDAPPPPDFVHRSINQQAARERQELYRRRVPIPDAVSDHVREEFLASTSGQNGPAAKTSPDSNVNMGRFFLYVALFFLIGLLAARRFAPEILARIHQQLNPWSPDPAQVTKFSAKVRAEEEAFARFVANFQVGPALQPVSADPKASGTKVERDAVREFISRAAGAIRTQRKIFEDIDRAWNDSARHKMMIDLRREMSALKEQANFPEVLLVWQVASAMEGLLKQLTDRTGNITASTLRTIRGGVDLLADLCAPGLNPGLLTERPLRFLAADDDLISRQALSVALKKALNQPDLVVDGQGAITLANKHAYDVIFLDVQMPGMDGFELCTKIRQTDVNRTTPVIFITGQSDFDARAQSTLSGGSDLMGKPFLTFEVTVKALTLALRGRLQEHSNTSTATDRAGRKTPLSRPAQPIEPVSTAHATPAQADVVDNAPRDKAIVEFLALATKHLPALKENCRKILETPEPKARQDHVADAFLRVHSFVPDVTIGLRHPAFQLSVALEGLLRKLLADPKNFSASAVNAIGVATDLLHDLCAPTISAGLISHHPVKILVVDDDIISRRAIVGALQLAFEKPLAVESGEAALAMADEKDFDVIFMDVMMPGMDGFATCAKIRESTLNRDTPVVFVTGPGDYAAQMVQCGGSDLMGKPFLAAEITLKTLTFALRHRLQKLPAPEPPAKINGHDTKSSESCGQILEVSS